MSIVIGGSSASTLENKDIVLHVRELSNASCDSIESCYSSILSLEGDRDGLTLGIEAFISGSAEGKD